MIPRLAAHRFVAPVIVAALVGLPRVAQAACNDGRGLEAGAQCGETNGLTLTGSLGTVTNTLLFVVGVAAVIMMVIGGLRYVLSGGDPKATAGAKDTVLYAAIGLVVALLGYAIVNFVLNQF